MKTIALIIATSMFIFSLPVFAEGLEIQVTQEKKNIEITPDDAVNASSETETINLEESDVPAKEQVEVKSIEVKDIEVVREVAQPTKSLQIETETIDISGTLNKPVPVVAPVKVPVKLSYSDKMKLFRDKIEKQNEEKIRRRIEISRIRAEMVMMKRLQRMMEKQLRLTENL